MITFLEGLPKTGKSHFLSTLGRMPGVQVFETDRWLNALGFPLVHPPLCSPMGFLESGEGLAGYLRHKAEMGQRIARMVLADLVEVPQAVIATTPFIQAGLLPSLHSRRRFRILRVGVSPNTHYRRVKLAAGVSSEGAWQLVGALIRAADLLSWGAPSFHLDHPQERNELSMQLKAPS